jgi:steroid 5-alpha reductase family enzyme
MATRRGRRRGVPPVTTVVVAVVLAASVALAGSWQGPTVGDIGVFALCVAVAFAVNWLAWVPAALLRSERFYDLTGSVTFVAVVVTALVAAPSPGGQAAVWRVVMTAMVVVWAVRLGSFLVIRVRRDGSDGRFDRIKIHPLAFFATWTLQALWVSMTVSAALAAITVADGLGGVWAVLGAVVWCKGFILEVVADTQKRRFRADPANSGRFIVTGLWSRSRHPNYLGEITLWCGLALMAVPTLAGWRWVVLASPLFVWFLLTRVSGIPLLEARATARFGDDPDYQAYVERTPVLVPRLTSPTRGGACRGTP